MKWIKKHLITLLLILIGLIGVGMLIYPSFSNWWNTMNQSRVVATYAEAVGNLDREEFDRIIKEASEYNSRLSESGMLYRMNEEQQQEYDSLLNIDGNGVMGYIDIPKIHITLPIYHGTADTVLQVAIGHLTGTSLPVGGEGTHCVVSGHRGLPSARLFTDLDKMVEGDTWTINVLDRTLTYEVDQIRVVEPSNLADLQIEPGKDYCTLVTCTPYGINTHRLLVRGHRIANAQGDANVVADALQIETTYVAVFVAVPILILLFIAAMIMTGRHSSRKRAARSKGNEN